MDLSLLTEDEDNRLGSSVVGAELPRHKKAVLNNRSKYQNRVLEVSPAEQVYTFDNNMGGELFLTKAFGAPGVMYKGSWSSTRSFCLTYFQWGNSLWARVAP